MHDRGSLQARNGESREVYVPTNQLVFDGHGAEGWHATSMEGSCRDIGDRDLYLYDSLVIFLSSPAREQDQ